MTLKDIAINNLRRRRGKVLFLVVGLLVGVAAVVALVTTTQSLEEDVAHKMDEYGANIVITPRSEELSLAYGGLSLGGLSFDLKHISEQDVAKIGTIKNAANIRIVSPKVLGVFQSGGTKALVVGVDFQAELAMKKWWKIVGQKPTADDEIMLGKEAADRFKVNPGSTLDIKGHTFKVAGVLQPTGSQDDSLVLMSLSVSQQLFGKNGQVGMVEVAALCKNCPIGEMVRQISDAIPGAKVTAVQQVVQGRMQALRNFRKFSLGISVLVLLVGTMVVFVTMMGSVNERTREIGIFSAIGFRRSHIMKIILIEALVVSVMAGIAGYLVGMGVTRVLLQVLGDHATHFSWDPFVLLGAVLLAVAVGLAASLYPAMTASKMDPNEALRAL